MCGKYNASIMHLWLLSSSFTSSLHLVLARIQDRKIWDLQLRIAFEFQNNRIICADWNFIDILLMTNILFIN